MGPHMAGPVSPWPRIGSVWQVTVSMMCPQCHHGPRAEQPQWVPHVPSKRSPWSWDRVPNIPSANSPVSPAQGPQCPQHRLPLALAQDARVGSPQLTQCPQGPITRCPVSPASPAWCAHAPSLLSPRSRCRAPTLCPQCPQYRRGGQSEARNLTSPKSPSTATHPGVTGLTPALGIHQRSGPGAGDVNWEGREPFKTGGTSSGAFKSGGARLL